MELGIIHVICPFQANINHSCQTIGPVYGKKEVYRKLHVFAK